MSLEQDVAAARGAMDDLERACATVAGHHRDTVDARRSRWDPPAGTARSREDLTLLCGVAPSRARVDAMGHDDGQDLGADQAMHSPGRRAR